MNVREDFIHHVVYRNTTRTGVERQLVLRGTSVKIAERIANMVKTELDTGGSSVLRVEPIAPANIFDVGRN